jgi:3-deoxy-D-manno-octulosonic-acid transferase
MDVAFAQGNYGTQHPLFLMWWLYNQAMYLLSLGLAVKGWWHRETREWNTTRKHHLQQLSTLRKEAGERSLVWMHCASLGEFEQGLPVLKMIRKHDENTYIVVSFFSPSGFQQRKNTAHADAVIYLPVDTQAHARQLVAHLAPQLFIGVKYEFWWNHLRSLIQHKVPVVYLAVKMREEQYLLKPWSHTFRKCLAQFSMIFTQDEATSSLLRRAGLTNTTVAGDTRVSSVLERRKKVRSLQNLEHLQTHDRTTIVYGSVYPSDLPYIQHLIEQKKDWNHVVVPHKVDKASVAEITAALPQQYHLWSQWQGEWKHPVLVVDALGLLFDLYAYARLVYVGGGFERSVHNTLEPAAFGLPLAFGPKNKGFVETAFFLENGIATEIHHENDMTAFAEKINGDQKELKLAIESYFNEHSQAMMRIEEWFLKFYFK